MVSGTLSYNEEFVAPAGGISTTGSGSVTIEMTLRTRAVPR
jgi:hypothetical protein